jgi:hypothetical protein
VLTSDRAGRSCAQLCQVCLRCFLPAFLFISIQLLCLLFWFYFGISHMFSFEMVLSYFWKKEGQNKGSAYFFSKGPGSKLFQPCRLHGLYLNSSACSYDVRGTNST